MRQRALRSLSLLLALVAVAACGSSAISPDPTVQQTTDAGKSGDTPSSPRAGAEISGSRLKRRMLKGSDGSTQFFGWFDSERDNNCSFAVAADGKQRCLPISTVTWPSLFEDEACTKPLVLLTKSCRSATVGMSVLDGGGYCASAGQRVFPVGPAFTRANAYQQGSGGACFAQPTSNYATWDIVTLGPEIPPSSFVEATEERL